MPSRAWSGAEGLAGSDPLSKLDMTFYSTQGKRGAGRSVYNAACSTRRGWRPARPAPSCSWRRLWTRRRSRSAAPLVTAAARAVLPDPAAELSAPGRAVHEIFARHARELPRSPWPIRRVRTYASSTRGSAASAASSRRKRAARGRGGLLGAPQRTAGLGVLGALKAGAAFLMLDPRYPAPRQAQMLEIARPVFLVRVAAAAPFRRRSTARSCPRGLGDVCPPDAAGEG